MSLQDEIDAILADLGPVPQSVYASVRTRLDILEARINNPYVPAPNVDNPFYIGNSGITITEGIGDPGNLNVQALPGSLYLREDGYDYQGLYAYRPDGYGWQLIAGGSGGSTDFNAGHDLAGNAIAQIVVGLQGNPISATTPSSGQVLEWSGSAWTPTASSSIFTPGGDLSGTNTDQTLISIRGTAVSSTVPVAGQTLAYDVNGSGIYKPAYGNGPVYNVMDFGAKGDGTTNDRAAIQAAINYGTVGSIVYFPYGTYLIDCPENEAALLINRVVTLQGCGSASGDQNFGSSLYFSGAGTAILIETDPTDVTSKFAAGTMLNGLAIFGYGTQPLDLLVVHAAFVNVTNCTFQGCNRWGILCESGTTNDSILGLTYLANGTYINSDYPTFRELQLGYAPSINYAQTTTVGSFTQPGAYGQVTIEVADTTVIPGTVPMLLVPNAALSSTGPAAVYNIISINSSTSLTVQWIATVESPWQAGDTVENASLQIGAAILFAGQDADAGIVENVSVVNVPMSLVEISLVGQSYNAYYSQASRVGYVLGSAVGVTLVKCGSEDFTKVALLTFQHIALGGSVSYAISQIPYSQGSASIVTAGASSLQFSNVGDDGTIYGANIPGQGLAYNTNSPLGFFKKDVAHVANQFGYVWDFKTAGATWATNSYQFLHFVDTEENQDAYENRAGVFGVTEMPNAYGSGLFSIGNPTMNTLRHWKWKQTVSLTDGYNIVYLNGGTSGDNGAVPFCDAGLGVNVDYPFGTGTNPPYVKVIGASTTNEPITALTFAVHTPGDFPGPATFDYAVDGATIATNIPMSGYLALSGAATGLEVVFTDGYYSSDNTYSCPTLWGQAVPSMTCSIEFDNVSDMALAQPSSVNGITRITESGGWNYAACITVGKSCTVTLLWQYDLFVPNYTSGNIG